MTDEFDKIEWVDPPPPQRTAWVVRLAPLTQRQGEWAKVHTMGTEGSAQATVSTLRSGVLKRPAGSWEFRASGADVYARYMGPIDDYPAGEPN